MNENQYDVSHQISRRGPGEVTLGPETAPPFFFILLFPFILIFLDAETLFHLFSIF